MVRLVPRYKHLCSYLIFPRIYLFFLPFQLVDQFGYYTIPGVGIAAFIYLGLIAAGEEIEQPFGACPCASPMLLVLTHRFSL